MKHLKNIMLIDDDVDDNYFHERAIRKVDKEVNIIKINSAKAALDYIKAAKTETALPEIIFLDINMPGMNGWEFLEEYSALDKALQTQVVIIMLTTSENIADVARAKQWKFVADYIKKPLTKERMEQILFRFFS